MKEKLLELLRVLGLGTVGIIAIVVALALLSTICNCSTSYFAKDTKPTIHIHSKTRGPIKSIWMTVSNPSWKTQKFTVLCEDNTNPENDNWTLVTVPPRSDRMIKVTLAPGKYSCSLFTRIPKLR